MSKHRVRQIHSHWCFIPAIHFFYKHQPNFISLVASTPSNLKSQKMGFSTAWVWVWVLVLKMLQTNVERFSLFHENNQFQFSESLVLTTCSYLRLLLHPAGPKRFYLFSFYFIFQKKSTFYNMFHIFFLKIIIVWLDAGLKFGKIRQTFFSSCMVFFLFLLLSVLFLIFCHLFLKFLLILF